MATNILDLTAEEIKLLIEKMKTIEEEYTFKKINPNEKCPITWEMYINQIASPAEFNLVFEKQYQ